VLATAWNIFGGDGGDVNFGVAGFCATPSVPAWSTIPRYLFPVMLGMAVAVLFACAVEYSWLDLLGTVASESINLDLDNG
jgi:hypothetical protein